MPKTPSAIPVGTQFSPSLIHLKEFLQAAIKHTGKRPALQKAIWKPPIHLKRTSVPSSRRTANLPLEAAVQYGLLEKKSYRATDLTVQLAGLSESDLYKAFARHILLRCGGLRVIEGVEQMQADLDSGLTNTEITGDSLARHLTEQGFPVTEHNTAINSLRMWLSCAGLFPVKGWSINSSAKVELIGLKEEVLAGLTGLTPSQLAFLDALCRMNPSGWCRASEIRDLAEATGGVRFGRSSLPKEVLEPLSRTGLIKYQSGGTAGGKTARLKTTSQFNKKVLQVFLAETVKSLDPVITRYYKVRPADIYEALKSSDKYTKGQALEAYSIHMMRLLRLRFIDWRKRANETGGAEIDVLLSGVVGCVPSVWQVQCKNTPGSKVRLEEVAKEVGQVAVTGATHVLIITNGMFTKDALNFAMHVMRNSPLTIFLLGKTEFEAIKANPGTIGNVLRQKSDDIILARSTRCPAQGPLGRR